MKDLVIGEKNENNVNATINVYYYETICTYYFNKCGLQCSHSLIFLIIIALCDTYYKIKVNIIIYLRYVIVYFRLSSLPGVQVLRGTLRQIYV